MKNYMSFLCSDFRVCVCVCVCVCGLHGLLGSFVLVECVAVSLVKVRSGDPAEIKKQTTTRTSKRDKMWHDTIAGQAKGGESNTNSCSSKKDLCAHQSEPATASKIHPHENPPIAHATFLAPRGPRIEHHQLETHPAERAARVPRGFGFVIVGDVAVHADDQPGAGEGVAAGEFEEGH